LTALSLQALAHEYAWQGRNDEAIKHEKELLQVNEQLFGKDSYEVASELGRLALIYSSEKKLADAEALQLRELEIVKKEFGAESGMVVNQLNMMGNVNQANGRYDEAERLSALHSRCRNVSMITLIRAPSSHCVPSTRNCANGIRCWRWRAPPCPV
jgi:tetratricopeptide (TPR) repeat protein